MVKFYLPRGGWPKTSNEGYYDKPGWATRPPVPWNQKFREPWNWNDQWSKFPSQQDFTAGPYGEMGSFGQAYRNRHYPRVSRRPPSVGNGGRYTSNFLRRSSVRCYFCGLPGHIMRNCYRARRAGQT